MYSLFSEFRNARMAEMMAQQSKPTFGSLMEITAHDYIPQVNKAGKKIWVVLHLFQPKYPQSQYTCRFVYRALNTFSHTNIPDTLQLGDPLNKSKNTLHYLYERRVHRQLLRQTLSSHIFASYLSFKIFREK